MTLASRIHDLAVAEAAAVNARAGRVGASAYDLAVLNGYSGTQAQYLAQWAPIASPTFTGTPNTTTPALLTDNGTRIPTTAWVQSQAYAKLASPALSGVPTAPTATAGDSSTQIATTAFVAAAITAGASGGSGYAPQRSGQAAGGSTYYQRIATMDGQSGQGGATLTLIASGIGDYGSTSRGTGIITIAQRGTNPGGITARGQWLTGPANAGGFFVISTGTYTLELWWYGGTYQNTPHFTILDSGGGPVALTFDSSTTTAPTNQIAVTMLDGWAAVNDNSGNTPRLGWIGWDISGGDWNANLSSGFYRGTNVANNPVGDAGWVWVINQAHDGTQWRGQIAQGYTGNASGRMFFRNQSSGTWGGWSELAKIVSPAFSGSPTAPTQGTGANDTTIATTAFVKNQSYATTSALWDIARITHSAYNSGGLNGFWQGYLPDNYVSKGGDTINGTLNVNNIGNGPQGFLNSTAINGRTENFASAGPGLQSSSTTAIVTMNSGGTLGHLSGPLQIPDAYGTVVTTRGAFVSSAGRIGTSASSRRLKNVLSTERWDDATLRRWLDIPVHKFEYKEGVAAPEEAHLRHMGMMAEDVHEAGFREFVHYEERDGHEHHGRVEGLAYERMTVLDHLAMRRMLERIESLEKEISKR